MDPWSFGFQEFCERGVWLCRLNQLNIGFAYLEKAHLSLLRCDYLHSRKVEAQDILIEVGCFFKVLYGDCHVIDLLEHGHPLSQQKFARHCVSIIWLCLE